jgi:hypothetical protein
MNIVKTIIYSTALLLICTNALSASNNVYKWKDKNGVVHYSQNAPQGEDVEIITTKTPRAPLPDTANTTTDENGNAELAEDGTPKEKATPTIKKDQATCDIALKAIQDLQKPIIMHEGKVMTIDQKNAELKKMDEIKAVHCP